VSKRLPRLVGLLAAVLIVWVAARQIEQLRLLPGPSADPAGALQASGVIRAEETALSAPYGGLIAAFHAQEGHVVKAGQLLVQMDTTLLDAEIAAADAEVSLAQAALRQVESGSRVGTIEVARARLEEARIAGEVAEQALADAVALRDNPQELAMRVAVSSCEVEAAQFRLQSAVALKDAAQVARDVLQYTEDRLNSFPFSFMLPGVPSELKSAPYDWWQAWAGVSAARAQLEAAESEREYWESVLDNPQELDAQVELAKAEVERARAAVSAAQAQLDALSSGATEAEIAVARSRVAQAEAGREALVSRRAEFAVLAPKDGVVLVCAARAGEIAAPGGALLALADLSAVELTVYVPENRLGQVTLGQRVTVAVDAYAGRVFEGRVSHIADQAEYTPRNVATQEERVSTVYAVDIVLANADQLLRPGMSADAVLGR
jgi:multidrug resistance efflux pump